MNKFRYIMTDNEYMANSLSYDRANSIKEILPILYREGIVYYQDWKHFDHCALYAFMRRRLITFGQDEFPPMSDMDYWIETMGFKDSGTMVLCILKQYDCVLKAIGYRLLQIVSGDDSYRLAVVKNDSYSRLKKVFSSIN